MFHYETVVKFYTQTFRCVLKFDKTEQTKVIEKKSSLLTSTISLISISFMKIQQNYPLSLQHKIFTETLQTLQIKIIISAILRNYLHVTNFVKNILYLKNVLETEMSL